MEILRIALFVVIGLCLLALWRGAIETVYDKILDIRIESDKEKMSSPYELERKQPVNPRLAAMARSRFWVILSLIMAPFLVIAWGIFILAFVLLVEAWCSIEDDWKSVSRRLQRR